MQITLSPELENFARGQVAQGRFKSLSAVVSAALENARQQNGKKPRIDKKLKAQIQEGIDAFDRGEYTTYDSAGLTKLAAEIARDGRAELSKNKKRSTK